MLYVGRLRWSNVSEVRVQRTLGHLVCGVAAIALSWTLGMHQARPPQVAVSERISVRDGAVTLTPIGGPVNPGPIVRLRLHNDTAASIYFHGYGPEDPWYQMTRRTSRGWHRATVYRCGTGAECQELASGRAVEFDASSFKPEAGTFRFYVSYFRAADGIGNTDEDDEDEWVWSPAISLGPYQPPPN